MFGLGILLLPIVSQDISLLLLTPLKGHTLVGTKASKFVVKVFEFLGFACWYPAGLMILKFLMGESVSQINLLGCVLLAGFGIMIQFLIWLNLKKGQTRKDIKDGVKYRIIGVPHGFV